MDWRTYVGQYPIASLGVAVVGGALVGRWLGSTMIARMDSGGALTEGMSRAGSRESVLGAGTIGQSSSRSTSSSWTRSESWTRATTRLEDIVNRLIDEAGDTIEQVLLPTLMDGFARLLGGDRPPRSLSESGPRQPQAERMSSASV